MEILSESNTCITTVECYSVGIVGRTADQLRSKRVKWLKESKLRFGPADYFSNAPDYRFVKKHETVPVIPADIPCYVMLKK